MFRLRHVPSLHAMLSLILKTSCVVLLETVVNFLQAYTLKGIIMEIYTATYNHFCLKIAMGRLPVLQKNERGLTMKRCNGRYTEEWTVEEKLKMTNKGKNFETS
ncbi:uncharacterized protein LOC141860209 isoform X2 [Acropora palmata]|uniref:uncharacterized protein LOC141860209 isoform X2 n=1 Tax=Acropora palmata TaxID=6131 RepID=UPI003DA01EEF